MTAGTGRVKWNPVVRSKSSSKFFRIRFRLYTGVCFFISGIILIIFNYLVKN